MRNLYSIKDNAVYIDINTKNEGILQCIIDLDDLEKVYKATGYTWSLLRSNSKFHYVAFKRGRSPLILLHRLINDTPPELECHFRDTGNTLDCRKYNLYNCTHMEGWQNKKSFRNASSVKNISLYRGYYRARKKVMGKDINIGNFSTLEDAQKALNAFNSLACYPLSGEAKQ